eukprot:CAMPEP_0179371522 /NCGR_PEP_ID=MMETSP0797-20121207/85768_1 /TAXON_ID=47934 /ORGANISM="Dinophysis acuminata, Strain DAEP01" /LENGTH=126 /DNA_ID=CAMNT_0021087375 /DNA_START=278 /DNA_END=658 /DNA_ORIENTATION=+
MPAAGRRRIRRGLCAEGGTAFRPSPRRERVRPGQVAQAAAVHHGHVGRVQLLDDLPEGGALHGLEHPGPAHDVLQDAGRVVGDLLRVWADVLPAHKVAHTLGVAALELLPALVREAVREELIIEYE